MKDEGNVSEKVKTDLPVRAGFCFAKFVRVSRRSKSKTGSGYESADCEFKISA
jgi:hypothetical protein